MMTRRAHERLIPDIDPSHAELIYEGRAHPAIVINYSLGGILLQTEARAEKNQLMDIVLHYRNKADERKKGVVIRMTQDGLALKYFKGPPETLAAYLGKSFG